MSQDYFSPSIESDIHKPPPPAGNIKKAERYINWLIDLLNQDLIHVSHTDLKKFDLSSMQDHYRIALNQYEVEVSHSKLPDSGRDSFIILFNNIRYIQEKCHEKVILAYIPLSQELFKSFKQAADNQLDKKRRIEEEKRFNSAMHQVDKVLEEISSSKNPLQNSEIKPEHQLPTNNHQHHHNSHYHQS